MTNLNNLEITKNKYSWGDLRIISAGINYNIIIHPKHWKNINNLESEESVVFKDEQNKSWDVSFDSQYLTFFNIEDKDFLCVTKENMI